MKENNLIKNQVIKMIKVIQFLKLHLY